MLVDILAQEESARFEVVHDHRVGVLDPLADERGSACGFGVADDAAAEVHGLSEQQTNLSAEQVVVFAEGGRDVDDAGTALHLDEAGGCHLAQRQRAVVLVAIHEARAIEAVGRDAPAVGVVEAVVGDVDQLGPRHCGDDCPVLDHTIERCADE